MKKLIITSLLLSAISVANADEGMWQPHQLPAIAKQLKDAGLKLDPKNLTDLTGFPMGAIVSLGGCTASFVSDQGLVVTNHHCAYGSIQYNSTEDNNLIEKGFLAKEKSQELPAAPGSRVYVTEKITDVSKQVKQGLTDKMSGIERYKKIDLAIKKLVKECEANKDYRCSVVNFHSGLEYYLFKQLAIRDVRLVHAPADMVGRYGGDIDNWMWPRHTGDYSFYRAYVGRDGKPADYSKDNVPYQPKHHLKISAKGVAEGDYIMVVGYPGRTNRYKTAQEVTNTFNDIYPLSKQTRRDLIDIIHQSSAEGSQARIKYESILASLKNYEKNFASMIESYQKGNMQQQKDQLKKDLTQWINQSKQRKKQYAAVIEKLDALIEQDHKTYRRDIVLGYMNYSSIYSAANRLHRLAVEKQKPDIEREAGYQQRDLDKIKQRLQSMTRRLDEKIDQAMLSYLLVEYGKLPKDLRLKSIDKFFNNDFSQAAINKKLDAMYAKTEINNEAKRLAWMEKSLKNFSSSNDPFIQLALATFEEKKALEEQNKEISGQLNLLKSKYMQAIIDYYRANNKAVYADANSTLRITYGNVVGYSPKDGIYALPFTRLQGITEKNTGKMPFDAPKKQLSLIKQKQYGSYYNKKIDSVPVNFLGNLDITGGNSGSPTLNDKAELVGLAFDGVYESIIGDWDYNPQFNRSIQVDSRYMLWVMEFIDGAHNLIKEMDIVRE